MTGDKSSGVFADDPLVGQPIGTAIHFKQRPVFPCDGEARPAVWLEDWESTDGVLLAIHFSDSYQHTVQGSAVMVGPGIAMCATHVIAPHLDSLVGGELGTLCTAITRSGLQIWSVVKVTCVPDTDISILGLKLSSQLPGDMTFHTCRMSTRLPSLGESVMILGFRSDSPAERAENGVTLQGRVLMCQGVVTARFDVQRDSVFMPWPAFEVRCPSFGGMSGGPVFDKDGNLIGLLCSSFEDESGEGPSFASPIWQAMVAKFEAVWPGGIHPEGQTSFVETNPALCVIDGREAIEVVEDGEVQRFRYRMWE